MYLIPVTDTRLDNSMSIFGVEYIKNCYIIQNNTVFSMPFGKLEQRFGEYTVFSQFENLGVSNVYPMFYKSAIKSEYQVISDKFIFQCSPDTDSLHFYIWCCDELFEGRSNLIGVGILPYIENINKIMKPVLLIVVVNHRGERVESLHLRSGRYVNKDISVEGKQCSYVSVLRRLL